MTASGFAARPPRQRMRPTRNNSVAPPTDAPADDNDDAQLSIVPGPEPEPTFPMDEPEPTPPAAVEQGEPELTLETETAPEETGPGDDSVDAAADATADSPAKAAPAEAVTAEPGPATPQTAQGTTQPAPETKPEPEPAAQAPAEAAEEPAPATSAPKASKAAPKASKGRSAKTATNAPSPVSEDAPAAATQPGAALAVINADGSVTVSAGVHLVDLREVAAQADPHALVDMLTALRTVDASDLRETVTTAIVDAITAASLGN